MVMMILTMDDEGDVVDNDGDDNGDGMRKMMASYYISSLPLTPLFIITSDASCSSFFLFVPSFPSLL